MKVATICYLESCGKTLMLHRNKKDNDMHMGKWVGIGGKFEKRETPEECVIREFREETGLTLINPGLRGTIMFPDFFKGEDWLTFVFRCKSYTGDLIDSNEGTLHWVDNNHLPELNMWEGDYLFLSWMQKNSFFSGKIVYEDNQLVSHDVTLYGFAN